MSLSEKQTRQEIIDKKLLEAGWDVNNRTQVLREFEIETGLPDEVKEPQRPYLGLQFSDYVLLGKDGKPLAVIEAKRTSKDAELGQEQAKQYCYNIQKQYKCKLPFCFYTNGHETYFWDLDNYPPRKVVGFPTRDDLERYQHIRENRKPLAQELINTKIAGRDYQIRAIREVMEGVFLKKRKFLLVMATGTGKTRTCVALVDALMRAGWAQRVLFLVDRIALMDQGLDAFKEHLPNEPRWPKQGEKEIATDRRIYISTYPTMLNIIRDEKNSLSPHFFDLVVVDESHRSIYNTYQEILHYFNAITLGLTATPTNVIDHNTFKLFQCDDGVPTFSYSYEEAVRNVPPYLCDFSVMKLHTKFQDEGISKRTISLEDQKQLMLDGKEVEEIQFEGTDLEKTVTNKGTNALIVKEFMEECIKDPHGVLPGKTIFFCSSIGHARSIERIFDQLYPQYAGELARVIVSDDPRVYGTDGLLAQFRRKDMPRVAVSVDMLDTGIDVREIVNLVFAKPVYSYTKFWQMIGRGTRLLEEEKKKPWCLEKDTFLIMDCWENFDYFKINPMGKEPPVQIPLPVRFVNIRIDKIEALLEIVGGDGGRALSQSEAPTGIRGDSSPLPILIKEIGKLRNQISQLPKNSVTVMEAAKKLAEVEDDHFWIRLGSDKIERLRNHIAPLFRALSQVDFKAMRFEKDVLEVSLSKFICSQEDLKTPEEEARFEVLRDNIMEHISDLPLSINTVAEKEDLIRKAQTNGYWSKAHDFDLDELSENLAPLVKLIDKKPPTGVTKLDLKDVVKTKEMVEFGPEHEALSVSKYREMVEESVRELARDNPVLLKIQSGAEITEAEKKELADFLYRERPHVTEDLLRRIYDNRRAKFLQFIRHILGIEEVERFSETVVKAFDEFIRVHSNLTTQQLKFLSTMKEFILERGAIQKKDMTQAPFTVIHRDGILGLFSPREIDEIVSLVEGVAG